MPASDSRDIVDLLPWALRRDTERYIASVRENARELFQQAQVRYTSDRLEQLLLLAAIQKLWATVNAQVWIVDSSLGLIAQTPENHGRITEVAGLRLGRATYTRGSDQYFELRRLRTDLDRTLRRLEIRDLIRRSSLVDLVRSLNDHGEPRGR